MDNSKYYNQSLAYDFERFTERKPQSNEDNIIKMPKTAKRKKASKRNAASIVSVPAFSVLIGIILFASSFGHIFVRLQINEVDTKITNLKAEISAVEGEMTEYEVELERRMSFKNIDVMAMELGMQNREKDQVTYIRVNDKDSAVTKSGETVYSSNR